MKTAQHIIEDTYNTKPSFKEKVKLYNLSLNDIGVTIYSHNPLSSDTVILYSYKSYAPIVLNFNKKEDKVVSQSISFHI